MSRHKQGLRTQRKIAIDQKAKTALHCVQRMSPQLDAKTKRKMVKAILSLVRENEGPAPRRQITGAQCVELVWSNSQCIHSQTGKCPLLIFGEQLAKQLNTFFAEDE
jgi:hypothetical protein